MDSTRSVLRRLLESYIEESSFVYNGKTYTSSFGHYSCNGDPISQEDYHKARDMYDDNSLVNMATKLRGKEINDFIKEFYIDVEETGSKNKRGHLGKNVDNKIDTIMKDLGCSEDEANTYMKELSSYTVDEKFDEDILEELIKDLPPYQDSLLYRGMSFPKEDQAYSWYANECKPGDILELRGPTSFSSSYRVARSFQGKDKLSDGVMIVNSRNLTGPSINHLSTFPGDEKEILCSRDTQLEVQDVKNINGTIYVHVKEVPLEEGTEVIKHYIGVSGNLHNKPKE